MANAVDTGFSSDLSWKVFLDRYAQKDLNREFHVDDLAIVVVEPHPKWPKKEIGRVTAIDGDRITVDLLTGDQAGESLDRSRLECDRPIETTLAQVADRVAQGVAAVEREVDRPIVAEDFAQEISALRLVPGGRIWAAAGTDQQLTYYNCYVLPSPHDSRGGIIDTLKQMIEIMSRGGGVGFNISSLRPAQAIVRGVNGRSSGAVSWMDLYSRATGLVEQAGCFAGDTRISTNHGLIPAAELYRRLENGETIEVATHDGLRPITARFAPGQKQLWRVTTQRGYTVEVTADHKMGVLRDGIVHTVPLKELGVGDEILTLLGDGVPEREIMLAPLHYVRPKMSFSLNETVTLPNVLDERLAYVLGYMAGNGYVHAASDKDRNKAKSITISCPDSRPDLRNRLVQLLRDLFHAEPVLNPGGGAVTVIGLYSRLVVEWLRTNGFLKEHSASIRVPSKILEAGARTMGAFVAGYFDADGSNRGSKGGFGFDSISLPMLQDVQTMLATSGIVAHISKTDRSEQGWQTIYRLSVTGAEFKQRFQQFAQMSVKAVGDSGQRNHGNHYPRDVWTASQVPAFYYQGLWDGSADRISYRALSRIQDRAREAGDASSIVVLDRLLHILPDPIVSVFPTRVDDVYDFEVADTHMLSGNGLYTSNSRRGALMLQIEDWHPDIWRFIHVKKTPGMVENANISVRVSDAFMQAVKEDGDWELVFPDTTDPEYDTLWNGNLEAWTKAGKPVVHYETVKARQLWDAIIQGAWEAAEPGIVFDERAEKESNSWYFNPLPSTNPCAEQPLPEFGVCTLGHVNLAAMVDPDTHGVDWERLRHTVQTGVRFLDNVIDATPYFMEENRANQQNERRIGLGTLGLGELLIRLGLRYGSPDSLTFIDKLFSFIAVEAYLYDTRLAKEKGAFPACDVEKLLQSGFMQRMPESVWEAVQQHGLRNVTILTQAPTGTVGTVVGTSTGIEPFYALTYTRQSRLGLDTQHVAVAQEWVDAHPGEALPDYFVGAMDLTPEEHVWVQAVVQSWTDSSISKTANAPSSYTVDDTRTLYELAYDLGCKGVTIYRDHSRAEQVLTTTQESLPDTPALSPASSAVDVEVYPVPSDVDGHTYRKETPAGTARVVINEVDGQPFEVFMLLGRAGSEVQSFMEALGRVISLYLRSNGQLPPRRRLALAADQLQGIGGANQMGYGANRVLSVVDGVGKLLASHLQSTVASTQSETEIAAADVATPIAQLPSTGERDLCPACNNMLIFEEGCQHCVCGFSKC